LSSPAAASRTAASAASTASSSRLALAGLVVFVDLLDVDVGVLVDLELVDADHDPLARLDLLLPLERDVLDLSFHPPRLHGVEHPTPAVDRFENVGRLRFEVVGQRLHVVAPAEGVDRVRHPRLVG
jgi:hypothetical protein